MVTVAGHRAETTSGDEGFFQVTLGKDRPLEPGTFVVTIEATRRHDRGHRTLYAQVVPAGPGLTVVSDFDDTVVVTGVRDLSTLVDNAFLKAPEAVTPVPRMASLYRCLAAGGDTPRVIQYVTATPMNLQSRLMRVLAYRRFPRGPVVLKRLSLKTLGDLKGYKVHAILDLARRFPDHRFVLLGDDGQKDPEVYRAVQARLKGRVAAILIRQVPGVKVTPGRLAGMIPFHHGRTPPPPWPPAASSAAPAPRPSPSPRDEVRHQAGPPGLVHRPEAGAGVAVEVLVEEEQVVPRRSVGTARSPRTRRRPEASSRKSETGAW